MDLANALLIVGQYRTTLDKTEAKKCNCNTDFYQIFNF